MSIQLRESCIRSIKQHSGHHLQPMYCFNSVNMTLRQQYKTLTSLHCLTIHKHIKYNIHFARLTTHATLKTHDLSKTSNYTTAILRSSVDKVDKLIINDISTPVQRLKMSLESTVTNTKGRLPLNIWKDYLLVTDDSKLQLDISHYEKIMTLFRKKAENTARSCYWERIIRVYEDAKQCGTPSPSMYMTAMKAYGHIKNLDQIKNTFKECKSHYRLGRNMYPQYIQSVLQTGDLSTAYKAYREFMDHLKMKEVSSCLAEIVSECVIRNNLELALRATSEFQEKQLEWDTYALTRTKKALWAGYSHLIPVDSTINTESIERFTTLYIDKLNDKNQPTRLKKLFTPAHLYVLFQLFSINVLPSIKTFNYLLECQSLDNQYGKVKSILSMMQSSNIQPDSFTVSILLRTFGSSLSGEDKMTLYHILSAADKKMDIDVHKTFLKIFTDIAHVKKSTEVLFTAKEQGVGLSEDSYMTILSGYIKKGAIEKGFKVLNDSHVNNMDCYAMLFEAFLERGQLLDCIIHYRELKKAKPAYMHAIETNRRIFKAVLTANIARRDWPRCRSLLHSRHIEFTPKTIMRIMNVLLGLKYKDQYIMDGKDMVKALECMENSLKVYLNSQGISRLIMVMGDRGECEACYSLYNYVRSDPASNKRCASSKLYLAMMDAAVKNSDGRKLERAWVDMQYRSQYTRPDRELKKEIHSLSAYNILLNGYASLLPRPDLTKTKRVFKKILNQNLIPDTGTYNILIKAFVNSDNIEAAYKILYKMIKSGIKPDSYTTNTILTGIINSQDWGSVEKFIQQMKRLKLASHFDIITYNLLLQGFLHLDSRTLDYVHLLKLRHKWERAERIEKRNASRALSSADVWNIFESATGYKRSDVLDTAEDPPSIYLRKDMDYLICVNNWSHWIYLPRPMKNSQKSQCICTIIL